MEGSDQTAGSKTTETETGELIQLCQCEQCPYTSTRLVDLKKHVQKVHLIYRHQTDDDKLSTDTEKSDVEKTVNKASSDRSEPYENVIKLLYKCTIENCGKVTSSQKSLRKHRKNDHDLIMNFTCPVCTNEYGVIKSLKIHMAQSHSSFDRLPLQITDAKIYKPKNYYAAKRLKMYACSESVQEVMICVPCGMVGTNEMLDSHCCLPKVPTFYCPCCEKPKSVSSENREEIREHIRREHGLDIGTETVGGAGDIGDADLVVATEQVTF